jgi:hypothetical protein
MDAPQWPTEFLGQCPTSRKTQNSADKDMFVGAFLQKADILLNKASNGPQWIAPVEIDLSVVRAPYAITGNLKPLGSGQLLKDIIQQQASRIFGRLIKHHDQGAVLGEQLLSQPHLFCIDLVNANPVL